MAIADSIEENISGQRGEQLAGEYLSGKGYEILATNWRTGHKEIDIIALKEDVLVFVEVKTRNSITFGYPETAVTTAKQQKIAAAAEEWLIQHPHASEIRFDVIAITGTGGIVNMRHIMDAFAP